MEAAPHGAEPGEIAAVPIADPLRRIGRELRSLVDVIESVQSIVGGLLDDRPREGRAPPYGLQRLDMLRQHTMALAEFSRALSLAAPEGWVVDVGAALRSVAVADLVARLHPFRVTAGTVAAPATGECEFFSCDGPSS